MDASKRILEPMEPQNKSLVQKFSFCINAHDVKSMGELMTDDHVFVDAAGTPFRGKQVALEAWRGFFTLFQDYKNVIERMDVQDGRIALVGRSTCKDSRLAGPALWTAVTRDGKVAEWRVHHDTPENRKALGLE